MVIRFARIPAAVYFISDQLDGFGSGFQTNVDFLLGSTRCPAVQIAIMTAGLYNNGDKSLLKY